ncbi:MAG: hypothetical protein Kilf2KO_40740 [Rhodospirillales bacterium]
MKASLPGVSSLFGRRRLLSIAAAFGVCSLGSAYAQDGGSLLVHPSGLAVKRPAGFTVEDAENGFRFTQAGALRTPMTILLLLSDKSAGLKPNAWRRSREGSIGRHEYRESQAPGGSGGAHYEIAAERPSGDRFIQLYASQQAEFAAPDFEPAWQLFDLAQSP